MQRAADWMRGVVGSWPFVFCFFAVMIIWAVINSVFYLGDNNANTASIRTRTFC